MFCLSWCSFLRHDIVSLCYCYCICSVQLRSSRSQKLAFALVLPLEKDSSVCWPIISSRLTTERLNEEIKRLTFAGIDIPSVDVKSGISSSCFLNYQLKRISIINTTFNHSFFFKVLYYTIFNKQLESGLSTQICLYFQDFSGSKLLNRCLVV